MTLWTAGFFVKTLAKALCDVRRFSTAARVRVLAASEPLVWTYAPAVSVAGLSGGTFATHAQVRRRREKLLRAVSADQQSGVEPAPCCPKCGSLDLTTSNRTDDSVLVHCAYCHRISELRLTSRSGDTRAAGEGGWSPIADQALDLMLARERERTASRPAAVDQRTRHLTPSEDPVT